MASAVARRLRRGAYKVVFVLDGSSLNTVRYIANHSGRL